MKLLHELFDNIGGERAHTNYLVVGMSAYRVSVMMIEHKMRHNVGGDWPRGVEQSFLDACVKTTNGNGEAFHWCAMPAIVSGDPSSPHFTGSFPSGMPNHVHHVSGWMGVEMKQMPIDEYSEHRIAMAQLVAMQLPLFTFRLPHNQESYNSAIHGVHYRNWQEA